MVGKGEGTKAVNGGRCAQNGRDAAALYPRRRLIMTGPSAITTNSGHSAQSRNTSPGRRGESPADANPETGAEAPTDGRPGAGDPGPPTPGSDSRGRAARRAKRRQSVLRQRSEHTGRELPQIRLEVRRVRAVHHRTARTDSPAPRLPRPERAADPSMPTAAPRKPRPTRRQQAVRRSNTIAAVLRRKSAVPASVSPRIPPFSGSVGRFFSVREPEDEQANGLYVLAGLYYLIWYVLVKRVLFTR